MVDSENDVGGSDVDGSDVDGSDVGGINMVETDVVELCGKGRLEIAFAVVFDRIGEQRA